MEKVEKILLSIPEFCAAYGISRSCLYNMMADGRAPKSVKIGKKRLISVAAAEAWLSDLEGSADE